MSFTFGLVLGVLEEGYRRFRDRFESRPSLSKKVSSTAFLSFVEESAERDLSRLKRRACILVVMMGDGCG